MVISHPGNNPFEFKKALITMNFINFVVNQRLSKGGKGFLVLFLRRGRKPSSFGSFDAKRGLVLVDTLHPFSVMFSHFHTDS